MIHASNLLDPVSQNPIPYLPSYYIIILNMEADSINNLSKVVSSPSLPKKRHKHNFLCIKDKLELIEKYKQGHSKSALSREYSIGKSTVGDIINYESNLVTFQKNLSLEELNKRKKTKRKRNSAEKNEMEFNAITKFEEVLGNDVSARQLARNIKYGRHTEALVSINYLVEYYEEDLNNRCETLNYLKVLQNTIKARVMKEQVDIEEP
jgi:hypothetical protein